MAAVRNSTALLASGRAARQRCQSVGPAEVPPGPDLGVVGAAPVFRLGVREIRRAPHHGHRPVRHRDSRTDRRTKPGLYLFQWGAGGVTGSHGLRKSLSPGLGIHRGTAEAASFAARANPGWRSVHRRRAVPACLSRLIRQSRRPYPEAWQGRGRQDFRPHGQAGGRARRCRFFAGNGDNGFHWRMASTQRRAAALSGIPGKWRLSSTAAARSPPCSQAWRTAATTSSFTTNIAGVSHGRTGDRHHRALRG